MFQFLEANKLNLICRTQWAPAGYKYMDNRTVLNVISTRNFCGKNNPAAMVKIDKFGQLDIILCGDDIEPEKKCAERKKDRMIERKEASQRSRCRKKS